MADAPYSSKQLNGMAGNQMAELAETARWSRDECLRSEIDATLVQLIMGVLGARSATVARLDCNSGRPDWVVSARMRAGDPIASSSARAFQRARKKSAGALPDAASWPLESKPAWNEALTSVEPVSTRSVEGDKGFSALSVFEVVSGCAQPCVLEIETAAEMMTQERRMVSSMLRSYRQMDSLIPSAQRDAVTGLLTMCALEQYFALRCPGEPARLVSARGDSFLAREIAGAESLSFFTGGDMERRSFKPGSAAWLGVIGVDGLSRINTLHGHCAGDEVLMLLARIVRSTFRHHDRFYRLAGDELAVVLRCPMMEDALSAFERFRCQLTSFSFPGIGHITASLGCTRIQSSDSPSSSLSRAQMALQEAKDGGRNRTVHLDDEVRHPSQMA